MGKPVGKSLARLPQVRHQARFWARRLSSMAAEYRPEIGRGAVYWGEDRQTQGRWDVYGEDLFVLGARMAPGDLGGGLVAPGRYRLQVADQSKRSWWWNYPPVTEHPSVMADSATGLTTACNWDDGGEKQAVGTGPDLLVDIPVPPGVYRLSLYLVNDFNYYEPNREYTIYLLDRGGAVLAACPVRDFEAGVYYHFAIEGPQDVIVRIFRNLSMNTLLQGLFLDRIDARPRAMADAATYGPLAALVATSETPETSAPGLGVCSASVRRDAVRRALGDEGGGLPLQWRRSCTLNGYGAGRVYEERVLQVVQSMVSEALGPEGATRLWSDAAAAQQSRGLRAGASRFTRYAVEAVGEDAPIEARLSVLTEAIRRLQSDYPYYTSGGATSSPLRMPIDEAYSRDLAHELAKVALSARGLPHAAADILPLARELYRQSRRAVPGLLFAAVGLDNLSGADLCKYAYCTQDKALRAKAFKSALAPGGPGVPTKGLLNVHLIVAYAEAGNVAEAEAEAEALVADPSAAEGNKANGAYALACALAAAGDKEDAARWFGFVVSRFPETVFAQLSQKNLANGRSSEKEARER